MVEEEVAHFGARVALVDAYLPIIGRMPLLFVHAANINWIVRADFIDKSSPFVGSRPFC